jgi:Flp pilus assembly protein TadD
LLLGAVLQRLGRHGEAADALRNAVELKKQPAATWVALGVSLEATGKKPEAVEAYRRSLAAAATNQDTRSYAEMRIRALR